MTINKTSERIVSAGEELFKKHGARRITIEEICRTARVSKMTFYKYFPNKTGLAKTVLQRLADAQTATYRNIMAQGIPFEEKVRQTIRMKLEAGGRMGNEWPREILENPDSEIGRFLQHMIAEITGQIRRDYEEAQKNGDIRPDVRMDFIFFFLGHIQTMLQDKRLLGMYDSIEALTAELVNFFFWGILPRGKT